MKSIILATATTVAFVAAIYLIVLADEYVSELRARRLRITAERAKADKFVQSSHVRIVTKEQ